MLNTTDTLAYLDTLTHPADRVTRRWARLVAILAAVGLL